MENKNINSSCCYTRKVYYYETDRMQIVHHSNYIRMFEEARVWFFDKLCLNYCSLEKMGLWLPLTDAHANYRSFLKYDERFYISVKLDSYNGCRMKISYVVYKEDGSVAADGYTDHCFTDPEMKILRIAKKYPEIHEKLRKSLDISE